MDTPLLIFEKQQLFFNTNSTKDIQFRKQQLVKLKKHLQENEEAMYKAIHADFGKSRFETFETEIAFIYKEINECLANLSKWSRKKYVSTNLPNFPANSSILPEPLGSVLVIGAWNYPYHLSLVPAISAMAAGNTVILKPSEIAQNTSSMMAKIINQHFDANYLQVIEGGIPETTELINLPFDKIFFTGSTVVGKVVYEAAAKNLTPVTLELGGKSPAIVHSDINIKKTVQRLVWAKFLNAGQTCTAPDYVFVHEKVKESFLQEVKRVIEANYTDLEGDNYVQIINDKNHERLRNLFDDSDVFVGGKIQSEKRIISPTVITEIPLDHRVMEEEIFGPILPVFGYSDIDEVIHYIKSREKPLSLYVYSKKKTFIHKVLQEISFGGGCVNDSLMHQTNPNLPFGGVGKSGTGNYHGKAGFDEFSHFKSVLHKPFWFEAPLKYSPYTRLKQQLIGWLLK